MSETEMEVWVDGTPLCEAYGLVLAEWSDEPPEVRESRVEIMGRDGTLDLTEAVTGWPTYGDRKVTVTLFVDGQAGWEASVRVLARLRSLLHGRRHEVVTSWEPGATYRGRASVSQSVYDATASIEITLACEPFRSFGTRVFTANAAGGIEVILPCGDAHVQPVVEVSRRCVLDIGDREWTLGPGSWTIDDMWLSPGDNRVAIDTTPGMGDDAWQGFADSWDAHRGMWCAMATASSPLQEFPAWQGMGAWWDVEDRKWDSLAFPLDTSGGDYNVYFEYEWKEL
nr:hypothetical protein [uncultured Olsenella sp.]